ncbi:MAG: hypothetical protein ABJB49_04445 [Nitrospirota bacterium]|jgi:hypothetical protein
MEARDLIRYRLLNYLIEAHECQLISANVAILSEIAEADWSEVKDVLNELFLYGDIVLTKDTQPYRSGVNAGWFFHVGNFQIKATVRGRREYGKLQILMEKEPPAGQAEGLFPPGGASSEQA